MDNGPDEKQKNAFPALWNIVVIKLMSRWDKRFLPV
jgi:hypothetical protein